MLVAVAVVVVNKANRLMVLAVMVVALMASLHFQALQAITVVAQQTL
jgi:hypothetical protein